jgi:hypothetical protein
MLTHGLSGGQAIGEAGLQRRQQISRQLALENWGNGVIHKISPEH